MGLRKRDATKARKNQNRTACLEQHMRLRETGYRHLDFSHFFRAKERADYSVLVGTPHFGLDLLAFFKGFA